MQLQFEKYEVFRLMLFTRTAMKQYKKAGAETLYQMAEETLRKLESANREYEMDEFKREREDCMKEAGDA